jgi:hypothetical protein
MEFPATNISVYGALMLKYSSENSATCITRGSRDGSPVLKVRAGPVQLVQVPAPISTEPCASSDGEHAREHFHSEKNRSMLVTSEAPALSVSETVIEVVPLVEDHTAQQSVM